MKPWMSWVVFVLTCVAFLSFGTHVAISDTVIFADVSTSADLGCVESKVVAAK